MGVINNSMITLSRLGLLRRNHKYRVNRERQRESCEKCFHLHPQNTRDWFHVSSSRLTIILLRIRSPTTPTMTDMYNDFENEEGESRRYSTPGQSLNAVEPINICTDCFFLLQQIRKKSRQRHVAPVITSKLVPSMSSSALFNRVRQSNSSHHLSTSSSSSSIAALLAKQRSLMVKTTSLHSNMKQTKSAQDLSTIHDALQSSMVEDLPGTTERVTLPRSHLFLKLQPAYESRLNQVKTG